MTDSIFDFTFCFVFSHYSNSMPNPESMSPIISSTLQISHTSEMVGATVVDKLNEKVDKIVNDFLSPYFGKQDLVDFFEPQYAYLPPQSPPPPPLQQQPTY